MDDFEFDRVAMKIHPFCESLLQVDQAVKNQVYDIRIKSGQPLCLCGRQGIFFLQQSGQVTRSASAQLITPTSSQIQELFLQACGYSVFSHEEEIRQGYICMDSHYRVGVCGSAVLEHGKVKTIRDITSLIFRIPRERKGCADMLFRKGIHFSKGVLIVGEPSSGKTTLLRDIARSLSIGKFGRSRRVAVVDEKNEISGEYNLGPGADILCGYPKKTGFEIALRMFSPEIILCDELSEDDLEAVKKSMFAGVSLVASVHASPRDLKKRLLCRALLESGAFQHTVCLVGREIPGEIASVTKTGECYENNRSRPYCFKRSVSGIGRGTDFEKKGTGAACLETVDAGPQV